MDLYAVIKLEDLILHSNQNIIRKERTATTSMLFDKKGRIVSCAKKDINGNWHLKEYKYFGNEYCTKTKPDMIIEITVFYINYQIGNLIINNNDKDKIDNIKIERNNNVIIYSYLNQIIFLEYCFMTTQCLLKPLQKNSIAEQTVKDCVELCLQTIEKMKNQANDKFLNELRAFIFDNQIDLANLLNQFNKISLALQNLIYSNIIPQTVLTSIGNFNSQHTNYFFLSLYGATALGLVPMEYDKGAVNYHEFNYVTKNIILFYYKSFNTMMYENKKEPNLKVKTICETLVHEAAHLSLNLQRDKMYSFLDGQGDRNKWEERMLNSRNQQSLSTYFLDKNYNMVNVSNAEHYAIFFVFFYLFINGKGNSVNEIIKNSELPSKFSL